MSRKAFCEKKGIWVWFLPCLGLFRGKSLAELLRQAKKAAFGMKLYPTCVCPIQGMLPRMNDQKPHYNPNDSAEKHSTLFFQYSFLRLWLSSQHSLNQPAKISSKLY